MLTLYDGTTSVCAIKVRLALHEKGIAFNSHNIDLRAGEQFDPGYLKLNPNAVVPTLVDSDDVVIESSVILQYLEDTRPDPSLLPDGALDRAQMRIWMKRVDDAIHPSIGSLTHATAYRPAFLALNEDGRSARLAKIPDEDRRARFAAVYEQGLDAPVVIGAVKTLAKLLQDMESALSENAFLAGQVYSLADCAVTPYVNRLFDLGLLGLWAVDAPNVFRWFSAIRKRANFAPAISVYLTDADRALFANVDPETPGRVRDILDGD
ncbi:MAG TPA: glutathione S-transferase [Rhodospirillaceae bacterium]|nr:glutathione S-transferase [Rhodospirillaceae bacterium]|tara:strand:+ start:1224 stop:2018 length:795 start_codon:yes stop_codon:yes gene_type:complete